MKAETLLLLLCVALLSACAPPDPDQPLPPPDPIGDELMSFTTAFGFPNCSLAHMYRDHERVQFQCFATDGTFSYENRGTLSDQGQADLDAALAAADLSNTTPVDMPSCHEPEANAATVTLWVDGQSISYMGLCPPQGVLELHDATNVLTEDMFDCMEYELDMLESVEPGCRPY